MNKTRQNETKSQSSLLPTTKKEPVKKKKSHGYFTAMSINNVFYILFTSL